MTSHDGKVPWQSKSLWVNLITTAVALLAALQGQEWIADYPQVAAGIAAAVGLLNIALRFITTQPITLK